ncbi:lasso peptide biosynthesis PqqD family chaperone [Streptomyces iconiensis]|uniref:Lasso peptide biosynthesis PqqD family chaperone n=1 Tax=Streptomyces iconiensis TaxID=1384038 RepID=A0ABT7A6G3_9ACTN|nr:lasso peptide biosynthesis PqqD family chaperone [Streptomyces iconiensis]MDJ1136927.1 lasso peptide biosynthesis PqqD family chaperone [Streptomyces iconiensis]
MLTLRSGVSRADTDDGTALLDEDSGHYWHLNPTAALVLRTLLEGGTRQLAARRLSETYEVDDDTAHQDVQELVDALTSAGLVER